jgi:hypothetical protein
MIFVEKVLTYSTVLVVIKHNNRLISFCICGAGSDGARELSLLQRTSVTEVITDRVSGIIVDAIDTAIAAV